MYFRNAFVGPILMSVGMALAVDWPRFVDCRPDLGDPHFVPSIVKQQAPEMGHSLLTDQASLVMINRCFYSPPWATQIKKIRGCVNSEPFRGAASGEWLIEHIDISIQDNPQPTEPNWKISWILQWRRGGWRDWPTGRPLPTVNFRAIGLLDAEVQTGGYG